jgi:hypothetical protein
MRKAIRCSLSLAAMVFLAHVARGQNSTATLDIVARITPTAAHPEPVRQFTLYVLTRSYADITKEVDAGDVVPTREEFIDTLKVSPELKKWLKAHDILDLTQPNLDKMLSPDDIVGVPEFLVAYQHSNSGGVTKGLPKPLFKDADKTAHPDKYEKEKQEYIKEMKKFIQANPATVSGVEMEMDAVNPQRGWSLIQVNHKKHVAKFAPDTAQTKYLAAKADTDLDGRAVFRGLLPGNYWISSLNLDATAGDQRVRWDVPVTVQAGQNLHIELTSLNASDTLAASAP